MQEFWIVRKSDGEVVGSEMLKPFDYRAPGALYRLNVVESAVRRQMRRCEVGSARGRELAELLERLDVLFRQARRYADERFDPAGL